MSEEKKERYLTLISGLLFAEAFLLRRFVQIRPWISALLYLAAYAVAGLDTLKEAWEGLKERELLGEDFLMAAASIGAICLGEFSEAAAVMLFYRIGELVEDAAQDKTRDNIAELLDLRPETVRVVSDDGTVCETAPEEVLPGTLIEVLPGGRIPLDGTVEQGTGSVNNAALTGESVPVPVAPGEEVLSGGVCENVPLRIRTSKPYGESTVVRILELVEHAADKKADAENFVEKFSRVYTPAVCGAALLLAVVPSLVTGEWKTWIYRALSFLVTSCPCALILSIPLTFFGAIGGASAKGILIKGSNYIETLSRTGTVVFDKTGTLTEGVFTVTGVHPVPGMDPDVLRCSAAIAETYSTHPLAAALREGQPVPEPGDLSDAAAYPGKGVGIRFRGTEILAGSKDLLAEHGVACTDPEESGSVVHVSAGGNYLGCLVISDRIKEEAAGAVASLKAEDIRCVMLTGDREETAAAVAGSLGIDRYLASLLPDRKVEALEEILSSAIGSVAFAGDGVNDAPVIMRADVGIAMGALGSDAAIEAADVVLMNDRLSSIGEAVRICRKCMKIVRENILLTLTVKLLCLLLSALGATGMWLSVFADVGVMILAVLNATRMLKASITPRLKAGACGDASPD